MREIKFRGKSIMPIEEMERLGINHVDGWVTGSLIANGERPFIVGDIVDEDEEWITHEYWVRVIQRTIGQFTGLKDVNGKGIYEGDVVLYEDGEYSFVAIIEFMEYELCFRVIKLDEDIYDFEDFYENGTLDIQIIGNIYENSELLEVEQ